MQDRVDTERMPLEVETDGADVDPFYSPQNMAELERRVAGVDSGISKFTEHELVEVDD